MAAHVRHPVLLPIARAGAWTFSLLFFLESVARASVATVLPLTAYALFEAKETVSLVYTCVSLVALSVSFAIPHLVRRLSRRWTYTLGCLLLGSCGALLWIGGPAGLAAAILARTAGAAVLNVTLSLYIMDAIGKRDLTRSESLRLGVSTLAWGLMPFAGVLLLQRFGPAGPSLVCLGAAAALAVVFWLLRLSDGGPIRAARVVAQPPTPLRSVRRFAVQPRLRLAWLIAFGRSAFWVTFFVYLPILMVDGGLGAGAGGLAVAAGNLMLFNNFFARSWADAISLRRVLAAAFLAGGALTLVAAGLSAGWPAAAGLTLVAAAFFVAILDGLGPVPFLRAVRKHERAEMATVYRTYIDASELLPQVAYFVLFQLGGFPAAFGALAVLLAGIGEMVRRHLPHGM